MTEIENRYRTLLYQVIGVSGEKLDVFSSTITKEQILSLKSILFDSFRDRIENRENILANDKVIICTEVDRIEEWINNLIEQYDLTI